MPSGSRWTLGWRLAAIGAVQLVLLSVVFMGVGWVQNGRPPFSGAPRHGPRDLPPPSDPQPGLDGHPHPPPREPPAAHHGPISPLETLFCGGLLILGAGSFLTARSIVQPLRRLSRVAGAFGAGDLRARTGLERNDELGDLARAFDDMGGRVERLLRAEKELLANVSHELRTPLARIRVALDIAGEAGSEASCRALAEVGTDLAELETLLDDVLTTVRLDAGHGPSVSTELVLHREAIAPDAVCERSVERFRVRHPARSVRVELAGDLPLVEVDPVLFRRVFDNLLENADKYSPDPGAAITVRAFRGATGIVFEVEDRGTGIAGDDLPHVFTPFFRGDRSRTRGTGGVGLGLSLAKRIVAAHGGTIEVKSTVGTGTTVRVELVDQAPSGTRT